MIAAAYLYRPACLLVIAMAILFAFGASIYHGFAPVDDYSLIVYNLAIRSPSLGSIHWFFTHFDPELYIPLTYISFFIDYLIHGLSPAVFHLHNLVLHLANACLVGLLLKKLTDARWIAAACALLFAVHPLSTEAVVWIAARKDLLSTFWMLVSVLLLIRHDEQKQGWIYVASFGCFFLALLAKVSVAALPIALVILLLLRNVPFQNVVRRTAPFFALAALFAIVAALGKSAVLLASPFRHLLLTLYAMTSVMGRMLVPVHLSVFHQPPAISTMTVAVASVIPILLIAVWLLRRRAPLAAFGILWMLAFLALPSLNVQIDLQAAGATFAADRYGYLPLIGLMIAIASFLNATDVYPSLRRICAGTIGIIVVTFIVLSRMQTAVWASPESLFRSAVDVEPQSIAARIVLSRTLSAQRKTEEAFEVLKEGLRYADTADLHLEAGLIYLSLANKADSGPDRFGEAREQFLLAIEKDPSMPEAYFMLGEMEAIFNEDATAIGFYGDALARDPRYAEAMARKASLLSRAGKDDEAEVLLRTALSFEPSNRDALVELSYILLDREAEEEAKNLIKNAILLYPEDGEVQSLVQRVSNLR